ncbi:MAG TPA: hypothetical protein VHT96_04245 [Clostridia bacterium]|nr:hypothetical protein [Clostridia bacterium]
MPVKAVVTGVILVIMVFLLVYAVEFFLPLSAKADLDTACRDTMLRIENSGGLNGGVRGELQAELESAGFSNIEIDATGSARLGEKLTLHVEGDFSWNRFTDLFQREEQVIRMVYEKTTVSRKVVN